ncbi:MAG: flagellar basal body rod protein FlgC [Verrucomicrobia bacterium]|jgi:flagellar basal-body rod protein FlgC|nr:MAG: flagellar basal body rod protein FlgC [Verrucomicrobiota bacterium]
MINVLTGITNTSSALEAERVRMEVISQNIANANTTRGVDGLPYKRQQVVFETLLNQKFTDASGAANPTGIQVARIEKDQRPPRMVFEPGHRDADPTTGMVAYPDINIHEEMADLITAQRAFEANLAVVRNAKAMAMQTLSIGKR